MLTVVPRARSDLLEKLMARRKSLVAQLYAAHQKAKLEQAKLEELTFSEAKEG